MLSGFETTFFVEADRAALSRDQLHLLQLILRAVDANSPISHEAAPLHSVVAGVPRAIVVLEGHNVTGQPRARLVKAVCEGVLTAVNDMIAGRGSRNALRGTQGTLETVVTHAGGNTFRSACATAAADLHRFRPAIERTVREDIVAYWDASRRRLPDVRGVSREAAVLLLSHDRHEEGILRSIEGFLRGSSRTGADLVSALLKPARRHRVACVVDGADELRHLDDLRPDAKQFCLGANVSGWGFANDRLKSFSETMDVTRPGGPHRRPACLISIDVESADPEAAAAVGRRAVSEMLDHYVSGHRLVDLTLRSDVLVNDIQHRSAQWRSATPRGVPEAFPLTTVWPASLGEAMRMAHIARSTDSPMAAAALSWSSIEAAGLSAEGLSGALALQTFRHRLVQSHSEVVGSLAASAKSKALVAKASARTANRLRGVVENFAAGHHERARVADRLAIAEANATEAQDEFARHNRAATGPLAIIRTHVSWGERGHLLDLNAWVDLLRPDRSTDSNTVQEARAALTRLLTELSPIAAGAVGLWRSRFARPSRCAQWLDDMQARYKQELDWLYATRNLTIHSGQITVYGDIQLASAASGLADLTLEFLGSWYATAEAKKRSALSDTPTQIVDCLDQRRSELVRHLRARHALSRLHAEHLTSCTSTGWDR
jgi:hypothetical protein